MQQYSLIFNRFLAAQDPSRSEYFFQTSGCSEYPAHSYQYIENTTFPIFIFSQSLVFRDNVDKNLVILFGEGYQRADYLSDYIKLLMEIFEPLNVQAGYELFAPVTFKDFKDFSKMKLKTTDNAPSITNNRLTLRNYSTDAFVDMNFADNQIFGLKTNSYNIRKACKARYDYNGSSSPERCRKVQIAHTALRLIYNNGWPIPMIAVKIRKETNLPAFYCLWLAYHMKYAVSTESSGYGDLFTYSNGFMTYEKFIERFFDSRLNSSVQQHFSPEENEMIKYFGLQNVVCDYSDKKIAKDLATWDGNLSYTKLFTSLATNNFVEPAKKLIEDSIRSIMVKSEKISFSFIRKLFDSAATGARYNGIIVADSRLGRIVFKDDNETVLSVLKTSKFIKIN